MADGIQAGDLMFAQSELRQIADRTPEGEELESLKVTIAWLEEQARLLGGGAITAIPPVRP